MILPDGRVRVPSGGRFDDYGPFLDVTDLDALVARTDLDAPKHTRHARGWSRE
jgi:hypothetical protein